MMRWRCIAAFLFCLCALYMPPGYAETQAAFEPGVGFSSNLGESAESFAVQGTFLSGSRKIRIELNSLFDASKKYTGYGWVASGSGDLLIGLSGPFFAEIGAGYTYRNGGPWVKQVIFLRTGAGIEFSTLTNYHDRPATADQLEIHQIRFLFSRETISWNSLNNVRSYRIAYRNDYRISRKPSANPWYMRMEIAPTAVSYLNSDGTGPRRTGFQMYLWLGIAWRK